MLDKAGRCSAFRRALTPTHNVVQEDLLIQRGDVLPHLQRHHPVKGLANPLHAGQGMQASDSVFYDCMQCWQYVLACVLRDGLEILPSKAAGKGQGSARRATREAGGAGGQVLRPVPPRA